MSARLEQHAAELLRRGLDPERVADLTTLPLRRVHQIARTGRACSTDWCGQPQNGAGRPRTGSIRVHQAGGPGGNLWFCSWHCVTAHATARAAA